MKTIILICLSFLSLVNIQISQAQIPSYTLDVNDATYGNNFIEFDIDITWTNPGIAPEFELAAAQYFFEFNNLIHNGGVITYSYAGLPTDTISDLPPNFRPRNASIFGTQLRLATNTAPGAGNGFQLPPNSPIKVIRMRLATTSYAFTPQAPLNLRWRNANEIPMNPHTKVFAYVGTSSIQIDSSHFSHVISIPNTPLSSLVELPLVYPANGGLINSQPIKFEWSKSVLAKNYSLQISTDSIFSSLVVNDSLIVDTFKTVSTNLQRDVNHFWRVIALDSNRAVISGSRVWTFVPKYMNYLTVKCAVQAMLIPVPVSHARRDTFTVYLRNSLSPYQFVDSAKAVIDTVSLTGNFKFVTAPTGNYYIVVRHFNSLETWSKPGGEPINSGIQNFYDFTTLASQAYGNNMKLRAGKWCFYSGDINQDRYIDGSDLIRISSSSYIFEVGDRLKEDLDANGVVDATDYMIGDNNRFFIGTISPLNSLSAEDNEFVEP